MMNVKLWVYTKGKGKYENKIGALLCELPNTKIIKLVQDLKIMIEKILQK